jgi:undecaprenyl-phosphate 4-deoxy-4-formamido-L-arabinose transferase
MSNSYTFLDGYLSWITKSFSYTTVSHQQRVAGKSAYSFKKLLDHSINIFVTFSNMPIRLLTGTAIIVFMISLVYSVYVVIRELIYDDFAAGFPSLIIAIGFGVSLMLLGLGVVGEYVYRINLKTTKKPNYLKQEVI